jgi:fumarate hydratase class II
MSEAEFRIEKDSMGEVRVPANAYYGAQTQRAVDNFPISCRRFPRRFIRAIGMIKMAAAEVNQALGLLEPRLGGAIQQAAREVMDGTLDAEFPLDIFQTGSGTSTNMNANEVIANRAAEILGGARGSKLVHPNDHVNVCQSSNDVIPTAIHVAALEGIERDLIPALRRLHAALRAKAAEFDKVVKIGRTHLQDATPIRLGQEFSGYARQVALGTHRLEKARDTLGELALGGTAVGTGLNAHPDFPRRVIARLSELTGLALQEAEDHFEAQAVQDALVEASGALKTVATSLTKIANDIRWLGSGPRCGLGELILQDTQPGSSIMPGKVNPVIAESLIMVCAQVVGNDLAVTLGGQGGVFELNLMMPLMASNLLDSIAILATGAANFTDRCVVSLRADEGRCADSIEKSLAMCTALAPEIGYDAAARIAKEAYQSGRTVREVARAQKILPEERLAEILDPWRMTEPGVPGKGPLPGSGG